MLGVGTRRGRDGAGRRRVSDGCPRARRRRSTPIAPPASIRSASSRPPATSTPARSIRSTRSPTSAPMPACGCTSMARTAHWRRARRMSATPCARLAAPIRCRSIRTSGCLRRLDAGCLLVRDPRRCGARSRRRRLHRRHCRSRHVRVRVLGPRPRVVAAIPRAEDLVPAEDPRRARHSGGDRRQHRRGAAPGAAASTQSDDFELRRAGAAQHRVFPATPAWRQALPGLPETMTSTSA